MSQVDVDSGIENMEVEDSDRREKRNLAEKVEWQHAVLPNRTAPSFIVSYTLGLLYFDQTLLEIKWVLR